MKINYVRKTRAVNMIKENGNKQFDIAFTTREGKSRFETVRPYTETLQNELGFMRFQTKDGRKISVNPNNTLALAFKGQYFKIRN